MLAEEASDLVSGVWPERAVTRTGRRAVVGCWTEWLAGVLTRLLVAPPLGLSARSPGRWPGGPDPSCSAGAAFPANGAGQDAGVGWQAA
jgi:hypothetical protein